MKEKNNNKKWYIGGGILLLFLSFFLLKNNTSPKLPPTGDLPPYEIPIPTNTTNEIVPPKTTPTTPKKTEIKKAPIIQVVNLPDTSLPPTEIINLPIVRKNNGGSNRIITPNFATSDTEVVPVFLGGFNLDYSGTILPTAKVCPNGTGSNLWSIKGYGGSYPDNIAGTALISIASAGNCFSTAWGWGDVQGGLTTPPFTVPTTADGDYWLYFFGDNNPSYYTNISIVGGVIGGQEVIIDDYATFSQPQDQSTNVNINANFIIHYQNTVAGRDRIGVILQSSLDEFPQLHLCGVAVNALDDHVVNCNIILQPTTTYHASPVIYTNGHVVDDDLEFNLIGTEIEFLTSDQFGTPIFGTTPTTCGFLDFYCYFQRIFGFLQSILSIPINAVAELNITLQSFFPFNLLADLTDIITASFNNRTTATIGDVTTPVLGTTMTIFTMDNAESLIGETASSLITTLFNIALYSAFIMMVYSTLSSLRFKS